MLVPHYWAESRLQQQWQDRNYTVRRFGWSDDSQDDAQDKADTRAREAMQRLLAGETLPRREPKVAYNGAPGVPIREEILARHGNCVITRNSYGAHCLNTPDVLFVDVDPAPRSRLLLRLVLTAVYVAALVYAWRLTSGLVLLAALFSIVLAGALIDAALRRHETRNAAATARQRLRAFAADHPSWGLRIYRTPAGLRVLVTHALFLPEAPEVAECFAALDADPLYVKLCRNQRCFRARLTGKPWRMGISGHMPPRPGIWPVRAEHLPRRQQWTRHYDHKAADYAACAYLETLGNGGIAAAVARVLELHDSSCRANSALPLA